MITKVFNKWDKSKAIIELSKDLGKWVWVSYEWWVKCWRQRRIHKDRHPRGSAIGIIYLREKFEMNEWCVAEKTEGSFHPKLSSPTNIN